MKAIPIPDSQLFFIMWHSLLGGAGLCYHFDVTGPLDIKKLEKSINHVINSHPILLSILSLSKGAKSFTDAKLMTREKAEVKLHIREIPPEKARSEIKKEHLRLLNKKTHLQIWPLIEFTLFILNDHSFHFFMGIDHTISDGLSSLEILHQIFSLYHSGTSPIQNINTYCDLVRQLSQFKPDKKSLEETDKFLENSSPRSSYWNPLKREIKQTAAPFHTESTIFTKQETDHILQATSSLQGSIYAILVASYLEVIHSITPSKRLELTLPTSGRIYPEVDLRNTIGCFAQALTLSIHEELIKKPFQEKVLFIERKIQQGLLGNVDKVLTKKMGDLLRNDCTLSDGSPSEFQKVLFQSSMKSNLYISFTGQSPIRKQYGNLTLDHYEEGTFNNSFSIDFMHSIFDGKLHVFANYTPSFFEKKFVQKMLKKIKFFLKNHFFEKRQNQQNFPKKVSVNREIYQQLQALIFEQSALQLAESNLFDDFEASYGIDSLAKIRLVARICHFFGHQISKEKLIYSRNMYELTEVISQCLEMTKKEKA